MFETMLAASLFAMAVVPAAAEMPAQITGTITYRQRIALPPNSVVHVLLQDVSRQDVAAPTVAEASMVTGNAQVPFAFVLGFARPAIDASHRYALRATISQGGATLFSSDSPQPVLTSGAPARVDFVLAAAPAGAEPAASAQPSARPSAAPATALEGPHWRLVDIGGLPAATLPGVAAAYLEFDATAKRIAGIGGCNRLMGSYTVRGASLAIVAGGMTMMACPEPLDKQEPAFTDALRATKSYRIVNGVLELLDGNTVVARFTS